MPNAIPLPDSTNTQPSSAVFTDDMQAVMPKKTRRSQSERSNSMRLRLIDATLNCIASEGYSGTTISKIIEKAAVSRGAPLHHFPSKDALIVAAGEHLVRRFYAQLGQTIKQLEESDHRLHDIIKSAWKQVFGTKEQAVMLELMVASRHDTGLAIVLRKVWEASYETIKIATEHYFEPISDTFNTQQLMILTQWVLRGMALDRDIINDTRIFEHFLDVWCRLLADHMRARFGVTSEPPRPPKWK